MFERNISQLRGIPTLIIAKDGNFVSSRGILNLITGSNVTLTVVDNAGTGAVDATIASTGGGGSNHNILSATHTDTLAAGVVRGDLIVGNSTPKWSRLAVGATATYVRSNGTDPSWQAITAADVGSGANLTLGTSLTFTAGTGVGVLLAAVSVNTIQGIRTVDTPQFLRIGIGVAADATAAIKGMISNSALTPVFYLRDNAVGNNLRISSKGTGTRYWSLGIDVDDSGYPANDIMSFAETVAIISGTVPMNASALFEVQSTANADPLVAFGTTASAHALSIQLRNSVGVHRWFIAGGANNFITGTAAGDHGFTGTLTKTMWHGQNTRIEQPVFTSGSPSAVIVTGAAHTTLTASTEVTDINFNLNRTVQFATGNFALQRAIRIQCPTYTAVAASTVTDIATVEIDGSPEIGLGNITATRQHNLWITSRTGSSRDAILSVDGLTNGGAQIILNEATGTNNIHLKYKENNVLKAHVLWTPDGYMELGTDVNNAVNIVTNTVNRQTISGTGDVAFINIGTVSIGASVTGFWRFWVEKAGTLSIGYNNTSAVADQRLWFDVYDATSLTRGVENDAQSIVTTWLKVTRSTTTVTGVIFPTSAVFIGSNTAPTGHFQVNGLSQFNRTSNGSETLKGGYSVVVSTDYTVASGETITIESNGYLQIIN